MTYIKLYTSTPEADKHFRLRGHNFNRHAKFTVIKQLNDTESNSYLHLD